MKTILKFILIAIVAVGCSTEDAPQQVSSVQTSNINPPQWIQGTWAKTELGQLVPAFKFTQNNFCQIIGTSVSYCWAEQIEMSQGGFQVQEQTTESYYYISGSNMGGLVYNFTRISATKIEWNGIELTKVQ